MTVSSPRGSSGFSLIEVILALTVLSVGLLATAALVRAVSQLANQARAEGDAALLAQQGIETALSERAAAPSSREDTLGLGDREYAVRITLDAAGPALERIGIDVAQVGPPGFGSGLPTIRSFGTRRRIHLPRLLPPTRPLP